jgi:hypothetical protein
LGIGIVVGVDMVGRYVGGGYGVRGMDVFELSTIDSIHLIYISI